ncbi:8713_t:CDS:2, partial [Cetraspora pellucida]
FLRSKQLKNDKAQRYNAKCTYCAQIFEARKEAITNHMLNLCCKISAESKILYSRTVNKKKSEEVTEVPTHKAVLALENNIKTGLQTFCETRWYSLSKVCLSVQTYENGHRHFFENEQFTTVLRYIVDAIVKLESNNTTLGDIFAELLFIYKKLKSSEFEDFDYGLIDHAKNISFTCDQATQISQNLLNYYNNEPSFNLTTLEPQAYWKHISYQAGALKILALKIFAIHPHSAGVEQLFSHMSMTKTKIRNRLATSTLKIISQINLALSIEVPKKNPTKKLVEKDKDIDDLDNYYEELFSSDFTDEENNELEFSHVQEISLESIQNNSESFMKEFINFDIIEELITISDKVNQNIDKNENTSNWTLDDNLNTDNK